MCTLEVCTTLVCVCTPEGPCSITICCISAYTIIIWLAPEEESPWTTASHWRQKQQTKILIFWLL